LALFSSALFGATLFASHATAQVVACDAPRKFVIIVDNSGSMNTGEFNEVRSSVSRVAMSILNDPTITNSEIAIVQYATFSRVLATNHLYDVTVPFTTDEMMVTGWPRAFGTDGSVNAAAIQDHLPGSLQTARADELFGVGGALDLSGSADTQFILFTDATAGSAGCCTQLRNDSFAPLADAGFGEFNRLKRDFGGRFTVVHDTGSATARTYGAAIASVGGGYTGTIAANLGDPEGSQVEPRQYFDVPDLDLSTRELNALLALMAGDCPDGDEDGIPDGEDLDSDNDGIPDWAEGDGLVDSDGDGIVDSQDLDSDNDGIFDVVEAGFGARDTNDDGRVDGDVGTNGLLNALETSADSGVTLSCGDGTDITVNGSFEDPGVAGDFTFELVDEDTVPGWDTDADDDLIELWDSGHNGVSSAEGLHHAELDANEPSTLSQDVTTVVGDDYTMRFAHRGRGGPDTMQVLIDGVVVTTVRTSAAAWQWQSVSFVATSVSTRISLRSASPSGASGNFVDGLAAYEGCSGVDFDLDGLPNFADRDSDADGITDTRESGGDDSDGDGVPDACVAFDDAGRCTSGNLASAPTNTDMSAGPDYLDTDSDNDGLLDSIEGFDVNGSEMLDGAETTASGTDTDRDGIDNAYDPDLGSGDPVTDASELDADGDGTPNWQQICGDAYVTAGEACDTAGTSATCTAMCLSQLDEMCADDADCDSGICAGGVCSNAAVDMADPDAGGPLTDTTVTPMGTSSGFAPGETISVTVTGPGVMAMCTATVAADGSWMCGSAITGLMPGATYMATASGAVGGVTVNDTESFTLTPCAGLGAGDVCTSGGVTGVCDADGGAGSCVPCADTLAGPGLDDGCAASAPICADVAGTPTCVACADSTMGGTDDGCAVGAPACDDTMAGMPVCVSCEDNVAGDMDDNGCMDPAGFCVEPMGMAPLCVQCTSDDHCTVAGELCNGDNMCVPGCNEMADCEGTPLPICDVPNRTCVVCLSNDDCPGVTECSAGGMCVFGDSDMDNVPDDVDLDDDNDGILDADELGGIDQSADSNANGIPDYIDAALTGCTDANADLICDDVPAEFDFDADGVPNHLDLDADGDGVVDLIEGGGADTDGDGLVDGFTDGNGDGVADSIAASPLPVPNTDGTEGPDFLDLDADDDGLTDTLEAGGVDADGDGRPDAPGADGNGDGLDDSLTGAGALPVPDTDGDLTPDFQDVDSDEDGISDNTEAFDADQDGVADATAVGSDSDMDGLDDAFDLDCAAAGDCGGVIGMMATEPDSDSDMFPDWRDVDSDGDGITDAVECPAPAMCADSDMDGTPDYLELDADDDGIVDASEGHDVDHDGMADVMPAGVDTDMDGLDDAFDADCAADVDCGGVIGVVAPAPDLDMDGTPDFQDVDDDGDSILTATEIQDAADYVGPAVTPRDIDEDGLPNWYDTDSDGDDTPDVTEDSRPALDGDLDDNDILDYLDPNYAPEDSDDDTIIDALECVGVAIPDDTCPDTDGDGQPDYLDVDDDNDGILTAVEYGAADPEDGDPENDHDADGDGVLNHLDLDADNDGIPDLWENGGAALDADGNGLVDAPVDADMDGLASVFDADDTDAMNTMTAAPTNTDLTGPADYLDLDADDDGLLDIFEADGTDANGDGVVDDAADADGNGLADVVDGSLWATPDTDGDGAFDFQDLDADGDGVPDVNEGNDTDEDGIADWMAGGSDSNGNGIDDGFEAGLAAGAPALPDTDGDATANWRDSDDDGDTVPTALEDVDGDGDRSNDDTDGDGTPNFLDNDDDGDTVPTAAENPDPDMNGDVADAQDTDGNGVPDYLDNDDDGDTILTQFEGPDPNGDGILDDAQDTDGNGTPDYLDSDDDGDGVPTADENPDGNGDGDPADALDTDMNGIPDYLDPAEGTGSMGGGLSGGAFCSATPGTNGPSAFWLLGLGLLMLRRRR
jgi:MYXO-CTERM domain-containing protein